jgi:hypothetical protein
MTQLPVEALRRVISFLPVIPHLFLHQRVSKTWKEELEKHIHQDRDASHLHFGLSDIKPENMSQEQFLSIVKRCGSYTKTITIADITITPDFANEFVQALEESNSKLENLIFAYCTMFQYVSHNFYRTIPTLKSITLITNSNFVDDEFDAYTDSEPLKKIDLCEYTDNAYLQLIKQYQLENVISREELVARFYNGEEEDDLRHHYRYAYSYRDQENHEIPQFGVYEPWNVAKRFYVTRSLIPINAIIDKERGYNIGHAYMASIFAYLPAVNEYFKTLEEATAAYDKWINSDKVKDIKEALIALIAHGLDLKAKNHDKPSANVFDMAIRIDDKWGKVFKKFNKDYVMKETLEQFLRDKSGIALEESKTKKKKVGKRKVRDDDSDYASSSDEDDDDDLADSDDEYQENPKRKAPKKKATPKRKSARRSK